MMYSAYKLNKQDDNITRPFPNLEPVGRQGILKFWTSGSKPFIIAF